MQQEEEMNKTKKTTYERLQALPKQGKMYVFTQIEKIQYEFHVEANSFKEAEELIEGNPCDYKDYDYPDHLDDGALKRKEIRKIQRCALIGTLWKRELNGLGFTDRCRTAEHWGKYQTESYRFTKNPSICNDCMDRMKRGEIPTEGN